MKYLDKKPRRRSLNSKLIEEEEVAAAAQAEAMSCSPQKRNPNSSLKLWLENKKVLNNVLFTMRFKSLTKNPKIESQNPQDFPQTPPNKIQDFPLPVFVSDKTSLLPDEILLRILSKLPDSQRKSNSLVSKRWLNLQGRLVRSLKLLSWEFLMSGRLFLRFPNLVHVDLVNGSLISSRNSGIICTHKILAFDVNTDVDPKLPLICDRSLLSVDEIDFGLRTLAGGFPNLRRLAVIDASELGLLSVAEECPTLQDLGLHKCNDQLLRGIAAFQNLQILRLIAGVDGCYTSLVSDVGLTILAQGCKRLVKLELSGCEGSYDGIRAIGQCCQMLEELTFCNHKMEDGWLSALSYCENLKTLRFLCCKRIDLSPGSDEDLGSCPSLERLHLEKCQLRDKPGVRALILLCQGMRELIFRDCWGLYDDIFWSTKICRKIRRLSLEGCSMLTTSGLELVILSFMELQSLKVISCNRIKDAEITPALSCLFSTLKDLQWKPDTKSLLSANLPGMDMGKKGTKFFKKSYDWRSLPGVDEAYFSFRLSAHQVFRD